MAASIKLVHIPFGWHSIAWSEDHTIAIAMEKLVSIFSLQFDPCERNGDLQFEKLIIKPRNDILKFDVGIDVEDLKKKRAFHHLVTALQTDRALNPPPLSTAESETSWSSFKLVRWSPACSQNHDRSLLACLALDHRLTVYNRISKKGNFTMIVDLSLLLHKFFLQCHFTLPNEGPVPQFPPNSDVEARCKEYKRRVYMLGAVTMDWSSVIKSTPDPSETEKASINTTSDHSGESFLLLAVAMKSGHVVLSKFKTPVQNETDVSVYSVFDSGYQWSASLSWCKLPHPQSTSHASLNVAACLAVGDREGRISLWQPQEEGGLACTFTKCLDVWPDKDLIAVSNMAWTYCTPSEASAGTATLVAAKGLYILAFLIDLSSMTVVQQTHIPCQHTIPTSSLCVYGNMAITTSTCGAIHRTDIDWSKPGEVLKVNVLAQSHPNVKCFGIAMSAHGIYTACPTMLRLGKRKSFKRNLNFYTVAQLDRVVTDLLDYTINLGRKIDQLEYIRQTFLNSGDSLPLELESIAEGTSCIQAGLGGDKTRAYTYTLRLRRFLRQLKLSSLQSRIIKVVDGQTEKKLLNIESPLQETERELTKMHVVSALQSWQRITMANQPEDNAEKAISESTSLLLMADWLSAYGYTSEDPIRSLVTEVYNAVPHSSEVGRRESCDLCGEIIAFTNALTDACPNGHEWKRCQLSLQLCQTTSIPQVCLHCEAMALPAQDQTDSLWLKRVLQECCILCESMFVPS